MVEVVAVSTFGWGVLGVAFVCIWVALAFWPARVAARKGTAFSGTSSSACSSSHWRCSSHTWPRTALGRRSAKRQPTAEAPNRRGVGVSLARITWR